jgi:hypothetical protein
MAIWWCHIDPAGTDRLSIISMTRRERSGSTENMRKAAGYRPGEVHDYENGAPEIGWQTPNQLHNTLDAAGGCPHHHDVSTGHAFSRMLVVQASPRTWLLQTEAWWRTSDVSRITAGELAIRLLP